MQTTIRSSFGLFLVVSMTALITVPAGSALPPGPEDEQGPTVAYAILGATACWGSPPCVPDAGTLAFLDCEGLCDIVLWTGAVVTEFTCDDGEPSMLSVAGQFVLDWDPGETCGGYAIDLGGVCVGDLSTAIGSANGVGVCFDI